MPMVVECPTCGRSLKIPDEFVGRQVRCADCAGTFVAEKKPAAPPPPPAPIRRADDDDDYDPDDDRRPRRRGRRRSGDYEPHRGGMILAMGIISLLIGGVGLVTGIIAWNMGAKDLKQIDAGRMDPEGRSTTQIGYILGIVGTILQGLGLIFVCVYFIFIFAVAGLFIGAAASMTFPVTTPTGTPPVPPPPTRPATSPKRKSALDFPAVPRLADYLPQRIM